MPSTEWLLVMPLRTAPRSKTRLVPPAGVDRADLALAMAVDTATAALAAPAVRDAWVLTPDPAACRELAAVGVQVLSEPDGMPDLNAALRAGVDLLAERENPGGWAVLLPDVPAATADDVHAALTACHCALAAGPARAAFVPDDAGTGTVLLAARRASDLPLAFGRGSAAAHERAGAVRLDMALPRLRQDVDTAADLVRARRTGLGARSRQLLQVNEQLACGT